MISNKIDYNSENLRMTVEYGINSGTTQYVNEKKYVVTNVYQNGDDNSRLTIEGMSDIETDKRTVFTSQTQYYFPRIDEIDFNSENSYNDAIVAEKGEHGVTRYYDSVINKYVLRGMSFADSINDSYIAVFTKEKYNEYIAKWKIRTQNVSGISILYRFISGSPASGNAQYWGSGSLEYSGGLTLHFRDAFINNAQAGTTVFGNSYWYNHIYINTWGKVVLWNSENIANNKGVSYVRAYSGWYVQGSSKDIFHPYKYLSQEGYLGLMVQRKDSSWQTSTNPIFDIAYLQVGALTKFRTRKSLIEEQVKSLGYNTVYFEEDIYNGNWVASSGASFTTGSTMGVSVLVYNRRFAGNTMEWITENTSHTNFSIKLDFRGDDSTFIALGWGESVNTLYSTLSPFPDFAHITRTGNSFINNYLNGFDKLFSVGSCWNLWQTLELTRIGKFFVWGFNGKALIYEKDDYTGLDNGRLSIGFWGGASGGKVYMKDIVIRVNDDVPNTTIFNSNQEHFERISYFLGDNYYIQTNGVTACIKNRYDYGISLGLPSSIKKSYVIGNSQYSTINRNTNLSKTSVLYIGNAEGGDKTFYRSQGAEKLGFNEISYENLMQWEDYNASNELRRLADRSQLEKNTLNIEIPYYPFVDVGDMVVIKGLSHVYNGIIKNTYKTLSLSNGQARVSLEVVSYE